MNTHKYLKYNKLKGEYLCVDIVTHILLVKTTMDLMVGGQYLLSSLSFSFYSGVSTEIMVDKYKGDYSPFCIS